MNTKSNSSSQSRPTSQDESSKRVSQQSRKLSWLLRHGALETGLEMDAAGWASIADVLAQTGMSRQTLAQVVRDNNKSRLEVQGERIRASQGHSKAGVPVTLEALEASWSPYAGAGPIWHGTRIDAVDSIAREGILPVKRTHVHLSAALDSKTGKRAGVAVMLQIDPVALSDAGYPVFQSSNGVLLTRAVPADCVTGLKTMTRRAHAQREALWAHFKR